MTTRTCQSRCGPANCRCVSRPALRLTTLSYWRDSGRPITSRDIPDTRKLQMGLSQAMRIANSTECPITARQLRRAVVENDGLSNRIARAIAGERGLTSDVNVGRADAGKVVAAFD